MNGAGACALAESFPEDTVVRVNRTMIEAGVLLKRGEAENAANALAGLAKYELGGTDPAMGAAYQRGTSLLEAHQGAAAAAVFGNIREHPGVTRNFVAAVLAELGFARANVLLGKKAEARADYQRFFAAWKDCDAHLAVMEQARVEFAEVR